MSIHQAKGRLFFRFLNFIGSKNFVHLLSDSYESRSTTKFFQFGSAGVRTRRPQSAQNVQNGCIHISTIRNFDGFSLGSSIFGHAAMMFLHCRRRTHPVKAFVLFSVSFDHFACALFMSSQHTAQHDKVSSGAEGFGYVTFD